MRAATCRPWIEALALPATSRHSSAAPASTQTRRLAASLGSNGIRVFDAGHGYPAWLVWLVAHIYFLINFRNRMVVLLDWAWAYWTFARYARVVSKKIT